MRQGSTSLNEKTLTSSFCESLVLLAVTTTVLSNLSNDLQVMSLLVQTDDRLPLTEEDHGRTLLLRVPKFGKFGVVLLLDRTDGASVLEERLGAENIVLDCLLSCGVVKIDEDRLLLREECQNLIHRIVLGMESCSARMLHEGRRRRGGYEGTGAADGGGSEA